MLNLELSDKELYPTCPHCGWKGTALRRYQIVPNLLYAQLQTARHREICGGSMNPKPDKPLPYLPPVPVEPYQPWHAPQDYSGHGTPPHGTAACPCKNDFCKAARKAAKEPGPTWAETIAFIQGDGNKRTAQTDKTSRAAIPRQPTARSPRRGHQPGDHRRRIPPNL